MFYYPIIEHVHVYHYLYYYDIIEYYPCIIIVCTDTCVIIGHILYNYTKDIGTYYKTLKTIRNDWIEPAREGMKRNHQQIRFCNGTKVQFPFNTAFRNGMALIVPA